MTLKIGPQLKKSEAKDRQFTVSWIWVPCSRGERRLMEICIQSQKYFLIITWIWIWKQKHTVSTCIKLFWPKSLAFPEIVYGPPELCTVLAILLSRNKENAKEQKFQDLGQGNLKNIQNIIASFRISSYALRKWLICHL